MAERIGEKMELEKNIDMIERNRWQMHKLVDQRFDELIRRLTDETYEPEVGKVMPLYTLPALFKGLKPIAIMLPNGREIETKTWKKVVEEILKDCNRNEKCHEKLMSIRNKVAGRDRIILGSDERQMDVPIKIDEGLYFEAKFDTETLLKVMCSRVLAEVGYDYSQISLNVYNPKYESRPNYEVQEEDDEQSDGFVMKM